MNVVMRQPAMSRAEFLDWVQAQEARYEFDGFAPVAMTGGSVNHNRIVRNIHRALHQRLKGGPCESFGPDDGLATVGEATRFPDAMIGCTKTEGKSHLVSGAVIVFEVLSPSNGWVDRIVKLREYFSVPSIHSYVIVEQDMIGLTRITRGSDGILQTQGLTGEDVLHLSEPDLAIPVSELYENVSL